MLGYVTIGTNDLPRAAAFYDKIFALVGAKRFMETERNVAWSSGPNTGGIGVGKPFDGKPATVGNGMMVAIVVDGKEGGRAHSERAASGGDGNAHAVGEPAQKEEEEAAVRDEAHEPAEVLVGAEAALEPVAAASPREAEVGEVGQGVGGHRHGHDRGQGEDPAPGQERREEHDHLALDEHAAEEEGVAVFEEERFHGSL